MRPRTGLYRRARLREVGLAASLGLLFLGLGAEETQLASILCGARSAGGLALSPAQFSLINGLGVLGLLIPAIVIFPLEERAGPRQRIAGLAVLNAAGVAGFAVLLRRAAGWDPALATATITVAWVMLSGLNCTLSALAGGHVYEQLTGREGRVFRARAVGSFGYLISGPIYSSVVGSPTSLTPLALASVVFTLLAAYSVIALPVGPTGDPEEAGGPGEIEPPALDDRAMLPLLILIGLTQVAASNYKLANAFLGSLPGVDRPGAYQTVLGLSAEVLCLWFMGRILRPGAFETLLRLAPLSWGCLFLLFAAAAWAARPELAVVALLFRGLDCPLTVAGSMLIGAKLGSGSRAWGLILAVQAFGAIGGAALTAAAGPRNPSVPGSWVALWSSCAAVALLAAAVVPRIRILVPAPKPSVPGLDAAPSPPGRGMITTGSRISRKASPAADASAGTPRGAGARPDPS